MRIDRLFRLFAAAGLLASGLGLPPAAALADAPRPPARSHVRAQAAPTKLGQAADDFGTPFLVEDLTTSGTPEGSAPSDYVTLGGAVYFIAETPAENLAAPPAAHRPEEPATVPPAAPAPSPSPSPVLSSDAAAPPAAGAPAP